MQWFFLLLVRLVFIFLALFMETMEMMMMKIRILEGDLLLILMFLLINLTIFSREFIRYPGLFHHSNDEFTFP